MQQDRPLATLKKPLEYSITELAKAQNNRYVLAAANGNKINAEDDGKIIMLLQYVDNLFFTPKNEYELECEFLKNKYGDLTAAEVMQCFVDATGTARNNDFFKLSCDFIAFYLGDYRMKKAEALLKLQKAKSDVEFYTKLPPEVAAQKWAEVCADDFITEATETAQNGGFYKNKGINRGFAKTDKNGLKITQITKIEAFAIILIQYTGHIFTDAVKKRNYERCRFIECKTNAELSSFRKFSAISSIDNEYNEMPLSELRKIIKAGVVPGDFKAEKCDIDKRYCDYVICFLVKKYEYILTASHLQQNRHKIEQFFLSHYEKC